MIHLTGNIYAITMSQFLKDFTFSGNEVKWRIGQVWTIYRGELFGVISNGEIPEDLGRKVFNETGFHIDYLLAGLDLTKTICIIKTE